MVAIFIIVFIPRCYLAANDSPAVHVAAGIPIGVVINKTVDRNGDLTRSSRRWKQRTRLLSDGAADRNRAATIVGGPRKRACSRAVRDTCPTGDRSRAHHRESYILFLKLVLHEGMQFADIIVYIEDTSPK